MGSSAVGRTDGGARFNRDVAARDAHALMAYSSLSLQEAGRVAVHGRLQPLFGVAGSIAVDRHGSIVLELKCGDPHRKRLGAGAMMKHAISFHQPRRITLHPSSPLHLSA